MGECRHFLLLIWKNFKVKFRHPLITFIELFTPCLCIALLFWLHDFSHIESNPTETFYKPYNINEIPNKHWASDEALSIFYTPKSLFLDKVMNDSAKKLNFTPSGFETETELEKAYLKSTSNVIAGIVFENNLAQGLNNTRIIKFQIRPETLPKYQWKTRLMFIALDIPGPLDQSSLWGTNYMTLGFLPVQHAVCMSLIMNLFPNVTEPRKQNFTVHMQRFPEPPYIRNTFYFKPEYFFVILICAGYLFPISNFTRDVVREKEKLLTVTLEIMGIENWMNTAAWYFSSLIYFGALSAIITIMLCTQLTEHKAIFHHSDPFFVFFWLLCYSSSLIASAFFLSSFFYSSRAAKGCVVIVFLLTLMPYMHMILVLQKVSLQAVIMFSLFPSTILGYSVGIWLKAESIGTGLRWRNADLTGAVSLGLSMRDVLTIFLADTVVFFLVAWYIQELFPGKFQERQPWYFPFTSVYWTGHKRQVTDRIESFAMHELKPEYFEKDLYDVKPIIEFKHLTKIFKEGTKPTVKKLCLKAYKNQITVLLGHDGSGKTTAISMLLGKCHPTSGEAFIKGCNVSVDSESRKIPIFLGFCPDYDVFFEDLSVEENLYLFCKLKNFVSDGIKSQIDHVLQILDLEIKRKAWAGTLSERWQRKLSVGIALIGESEVVVMDDPTNRMDDYGRMIVWEALKNERAFRTIFITTNHMKEAEAIADRIGIIDEGELQSCGSVSFLRNRYGAGYYLIIEKDDSCNVNTVTNFIKSHISKAELHNSTDTLKYILPHDKREMFQFLLQELDEKKEKLKIANYFVSQVSMDDLFHKSSFKASSFSLPDFRKVAREDETFSNAGVDDEYQNLLFVKERYESFVLIIRQVAAVLKKQFLYSIRHTFLLLSQILVLPIIFVVSFTFIKEHTFSDSFLALDLDLFNAASRPTQIHYAVNLNDKLSTNLSKVFVSLFDSPNQTFFIDLREESIDEHLIELAEENPLDYHKICFIAVEFRGDGNNGKITAFYNNKFIHSPALSLLFVHNTILKYVAKGSSPHSFEVINHPLPPKVSTVNVINTVKSLLPSFLTAQDLMFSVSIVMAGFIVPLVMEKSSGFKKMQLKSGLNCFYYWMSSFLFDFSIYSVASSLLLTAFFTTGLYGCSHQEQLGRVTLLLLIHGIVGLLFVYCCSFFAHYPSKGYIFIFLYHLLGLIAQFSMALLERRVSRKAYDDLDILFSLFLPCYSFVQGFLNLHKNSELNQMCNNERVKLFCQENGKSSMYFDSNCCKEKCGNKCYRWEEDFFSWNAPGIGKQIFLPFLHIFIFIAIIILLEFKVFNCIRLQLFPRFAEKTADGQMEEARNDSDEPLNTAPSLDGSHYLFVEKVTKYFGSKRAIDNLTFGIHRGESFGLIGKAKSGKTTIVKIITGDVPMSYGKVYVDGKDILSQSKAAEDKIGPCPEINALLEHLTGEETLLLFANLRGIPNQKISSCVCHLSSLLALDHYLKQKVKKYNSCVKRKLNTALSLIGTPPLIILDEPTARMDPKSCRCVWNALLQAMNSGCTIFITSERMAECEAVCRRMGIIASGQLVYTGSLSDLKKSSGEGYTLVVRLPNRKQSHQATTIRVNSEEAKISIENILPEAVLKVDFSTSLYYYIPHPDIKWAAFFRAMEKAKRQQYISDYLISETTLEQILFYATTESSIQGKMISEFLKERMK